MRNTLHEQQLFSMTDLDTIFTRLPPQDIEEFYQLYQLWSLRQKRERVIAQLNELEQQIAANEALFDAACPSPIALATLSQFRAVGVADIDLLDRMLERGDEWLDHTLQLFERCERLDMLQGDITEWCTHALEGAYDWIESMDDIDEKSASDDDTLLSIPAISPAEQSLSEPELLPATTEADFLQKLMSEDGENRELAYILPHSVPDIQEYSEPTEDQMQDPLPTEPDNIPEQIDPPDQPVSVSLVPDIQEYSEPTEDQMQDPLPIEPDNIPEQIDPSAQPASVSQPAPNVAQKRASQIRRSLKIPSKKQRGRHKKQNYNQYKRKWKRSK